MVVDESSAPRQHAVVDSAQLNAITRLCSPSSLIPHPSSLSLLALVVLAWGVFSWALVAQHRSYRSHAYDLGFFDQIIWNTSRGRWFETSFLSWNFLGQHVEPVLLLFAAVYRVWPNVELLLLTEAAVAAWAAVPLYLAARKLLASDAAGLMVGAAYLLSPHLHGAVLFDFHPEVMGTASIFAAFALIVNRRPGWALAAIGTLFLLKEDAALAGVGFAVVIWLRGYRRHALTLVAASMLYLLLVVGVLMTAIRGGAGDLQSRYSWIGRSPTEIISAPIRRPGAVAAHLVGPRQRGAVAYVLGSLAFVPLAGPGALAAAPLLIANLLSMHEPQSTLTLHYPILPLALLFVAAVLGIERLTHARWPWAALAGRVRSPRARGIAVAAALLAAESVAWLAGSPLGVRFDSQRFRATEHTKAVERLLAMVPDGVPVSAQTGLLPHLSQRQQVWEFPLLLDASYVAVDRKGLRSYGSEAGYLRDVGALPARGFCLLASDDGVELYAKGEPCASR